MDLFKTIILIILILGVIGGIVFFGYKIMTTPSVKQNNDTENYVVINKDVKNEIPENTVSSGDDNLQIKIIDKDATTNESDLNQTLAKDMEKLYGTGLNINNDDPTNPGSDFIFVGFKIATNSKATYYVPNDWTRNGEKMVDPITGANVKCSYRKTSELVEEVYNETTYIEVLNAFMDAERQLSNDPDNVTFESRELTNSSGTYTIIIKRDGIAVTSYIVYVKDLNEYHLAFTTSEEDYNDLTVELINKIFSSFKIL